MDAALSPLTADYTGQRLSNLGNAVYLRIMTPLGSWWADPSLGSRLHELEREKDVPRIRMLARQYIEQALQSLITDGRATSVSVRVDQPHNGRCHYLVEVVDATGHTQTFSHFVRVA